MGHSLKVPSGKKSKIEFLVAQYCLDTDAIYCKITTKETDFYGFQKHLERPVILKKT